MREYQREVKANEKLNRSYWTLKMIGHASYKGDRVLIGKNYYSDFAYIVTPYIRNGSFCRLLINSF